MRHFCLRFPSHPLTKLVRPQRDLLNVPPPFLRRQVAATSETSRKERLTWRSPLGGRRGVPCILPAVADEKEAAGRLSRCKEAVESRVSRGR